ncbi:Fic family protein [Gordonia sp. X0973]|uniref:Fic family protein n=1 Tax=Gordonia sp. X0973 TaxID=2742602 RepID=UPI000F52D8EC|nr:Fic family protein [Gordonia sp. X0973]QKT06930.1 Fic family protein [Gordonia sp. X0973]
MPAYVERLWNAEDTGGLARADRTPGVYRAYVPDTLGTALPSLSPRTADAASDALVVLARADERITADAGYLNYLLIHSESISSSWIEGKRVTAKRLAVAEVLNRGSRAALEVVANVRATTEAITDLSDPDRPITIDAIERLQHVIEPRLQSGLRTEQNWVGGPGWSPLRADFIPPPETEVHRLVEDLCRFSSATAGNAVVRAAIAHAQFETIHPFIDGNGRTGRALIHPILRRADAVRHAIVPISSVFAADADSYIAGLTAFRAGDVDAWVTGFAHAVEVAAANAVRLAERVVELDEKCLVDLVDHRRRQGASPAVPRADSLVLRILGSLASYPVLTADLVTARLGASSSAAHRALVELADAGILGRSKDPRGRLVCFTADGYLALVGLTER